MEEDVLFCGAAIENDVCMLEYYNIAILGATDLQQQIPNPTTNYPPTLYALSNAYIGTNLSKKDPKMAVIRSRGLSNFPLSFDQVKYAALDARLSFEIPRRCWQLIGYDSPSDHLNVIANE